MDNCDNEDKLFNLTPITVFDCISYPPVRYILDGIIEAETITLFSGKEKIGKTYVLMNMALCMAAGIPWLGLQTMQDDNGKVLWLDFDMNRDTSKRRINQITNGIEEAWNIRKPDFFNNFELMDSQVFRDGGCEKSFHFFGKSDAVEALREYLIANNVKVCFIDNLVQIEGEAEENSSNDIQYVFSGLKQLRDETHCSFIIIHHTTKDGNRGRGSSAIFGETDLNLQLEPCEGENQLKLITDGARNTANHEIGMCARWIPRIGEDGVNPLKDDNGHAIFNFKLIPVKVSELVTTRELNFKSKKSALTLESNIKNIVKLFNLNGNEPLTQTSIIRHCEMTGTNETRKKAILEALNRKVLIFNSDNGKYSLDSKDTDNTENT